MVSRHLGFEFAESCLEFGALLSKSSNYFGSNLTVKIGEVFFGRHRIKASLDAEFWCCYCDYIGQM